MSFEIIVVLFVILLVVVIFAHGHLARIRAIEDANRRIINEQIRCIDEIDSLFLLENKIPITDSLRAFLQSSISRRVSTVLAIDPKNLIAKQKLRNINTEKPMSLNSELMTDEEILTHFTLPVSQEGRKLFADGVRSFRNALRMEAKECPEKFAHAKKESGRLHFLQLRLVIDIMLERANAALINGSFSTTNELLRDIEPYLSKIETHLYPEYINSTRSIIHRIREATAQRSEEREQRVQAELRERKEGDGLERMLDTSGKTKW